MELALALVAVLALAASPPITIWVLSKRDRDLSEKLGSHLLTFLRTHQNTGEPVALTEQRIKLESEKVAATREANRLRAAEMAAQADSFLGGARPQ